MIQFINAKINLGLNIVRKREDGYHDLETVFYPVGLYNGTPENPEPFCDILEIHHTGTEKFVFSGRGINCRPEQNLVCKATALFKEEMESLGKRHEEFHIHLEKHLPDGAGLGGGSADASFILVALNRLSGSPFNTEDLERMALKLGADCPFFIRNKAIYATGVGEKMTPINLDLSGYWCVIIKPDVYISTREAFSGITPQTADRNIREILKAPVAEWEKEGLLNDFERHIFTLYPLLGEIKNFLNSSGALYSAMSGSGSSIFGIFDSRTVAHRAYTSAKSRSNNIESYLIKL